MTGPSSRRGFLVRVGALLGGLLIGSLPVVVLPVRAKTVALPSPLRSAGAHSIGREYLRMLGPGIARVREHWHPLLAQGWDNSWIAEAVRRDFGNGDTVVVRSWILSRTEAELCALTADQEKAQSLSWVSPSRRG